MPRPSHHAVLLLALAAVLVTSAGCNFRADRARLLGYRALDDGDYPAATDQFTYAIDHDSTDWISHYYLGKIELDRNNDPTAARRHLELAESIREANEAARYGEEVGVGTGKVPRPTRAQLTDALAEALFRQGQRNQLVAYLRNVVEEHGDTDDYLRLARYMHKLGDPDAAQLAFEQAIKIAPATNPQPYLQFGEFFDAIGDGNNALIQYRKAYYIDPEIAGLAEKIRSHGMVPGPTVGLPPDAKGR